MLCDPLFTGHDAPETKMICAGADLTLAPRSRDVPRTVLVCTQIGSASMHLFPLGWLRGIQRSIGSLRVSGDHAEGSKLLVVIWPVPVAGPLPNVSRHVVKSVRIRRIMRHGGCPDKSVFTGVRVGKVPLMRVCHPFPLRAKFVSPNKRLAGYAATRGKFPFRLRGQSLPRPFCIRCGIFIRDLDNRIIFFPLNVAFRAARVTPIGPFHVAPPLQVIIERHGVIGRRKDNAPGNKILRWRSRKILSSWRALRDSHVPRRLYELRELRVGHIRLVYVEAIHINAVNRTSVKRGLHPHIVHVGRIICPHREFPPGNPRHSFRSSSGSRAAILNRGLKSAYRGAGAQNFGSAWLRSCPHRATPTRRMPPVGEIRRAREQRDRGDSQPHRDSSMLCTLCCGRRRRNRLRSSMTAQGSPSTELSIIGIPVA